MPERTLPSSVTTTSELKFSLTFFVRRQQRLGDVIDLRGRAETDQVGAGSADGVALQAVQFFAAINLFAAMSVSFLGDFGDEGFHLVGREFTRAARQAACFRERFAQRGNLPAGGIEHSEHELRRVCRQFFAARSPNFRRDPPVGKSVAFLSELA